MGKEKQRTKGGVKPSSSGRTAELLFKSAGTLEASNVFSGFVPVAAFGVQDFDGQGSTLSSDLRLILRKFGKKDATTKIKALGEITEIFGNDAQACTEVLQYWPKLYSKLATDDSRKVRELSHVALEGIGKQVGRNLGPHMKSLLPYWFLGQFDIYPTARCTAKKALNVVFPVEKKQEEAIKFAREEIMSLVMESLTCKTAPAKKISSDNADAGGDVAEPYELRMAFASILGLNRLIEKQLVEEEQVNPIVQSDQFWSFTKHQSTPVRQQFFNLVTSIANWKPSLIQVQCIKAITHSLKEETSDCLQSLWNCFLTLTLNCSAFSADSNMAKSQILKVCRKGFYGNARSLGPALLPLVAKIGVDQDFLGQLLPALQSGFVNERSASEKAAILRAYGETLAYAISSCGTSQLEKVLVDTVYPFTGSVINSGSYRDYAATLGSFIKSDEFFKTMAEWLIMDTTVNRANLGRFIVATCSSKSDQPQVGKSVRFSEETNASDDGSIPSFSELPECKKTTVSNLASKSLETENGLDLFSVLSNAFRSEDFYKTVIGGQPQRLFDSSAFKASEEFTSKLGVILDLLKTFPSVPSILAELSTLFDTKVTDSSTMKTFLNSLKPQLSSSTVKKWLQQDLFVAKVKDILVVSEELYDREIHIIKFILQQQEECGKEVVQFCCDRIMRRLQVCEGSTDIFLMDLLGIIRSAGKPDMDVLKPLVSEFFRVLIGFAAHPQTDEEMTEATECLVAESIALVPVGGVYNVDVLNLIHQQVNVSKDVSEIEALVNVTDYLDSAPELTLATPVALPASFERSHVKAFFNFTGLSYIKSGNSKVVDSATTDIKDMFLHINYISRTIYDLKILLKGEMDETEDPEAGTNAVVKVFSAQAVCKFWQEAEKYDMNKTLNEALVSELKALSSRLLERLVANGKWSRRREEILDELSKSSKDLLVLSKLPLQLFLEAAKKLDLEVPFTGRTKQLNQFIMDDSVALTDDRCSAFLDNLICDYFLERQAHSVSPVVDYLTIQRKDYATRMHFERLWSLVDLKDREVLIAVLEVVNQILALLLERDDKSNDDFVTSAACWVAAWLKMTKNLPQDLDEYSLLWVNKLGQAVKLLAGHARRPGQFSLEYMEFHASNLYIPLYYLFLQLTKLDHQNFVVCRTTEIVAVALSTVPTVTINFIEPVTAKLCPAFVPLLENSRPAVQLTAARVLRKLKNTMMTIEGNEETSIIPAELNDLIKTYGEKLEVTELETLQHTEVLTYLLAWDILLTMHADRSCNEFGNFAKEPHLLPQFLSIVFFNCLNLIPESRLTTYFESDPKLDAGTVPPNFSHLVCSVLVKALKCLPYSARWWWNTQLSKQRDKIMVERFITKYLTSKLISDELSRVKWEDSETVTVQSLPGCNELVAHYKFEDTAISITISLPLNHPLGPISVKISDKKLLGKITNLLNNKANSLAAGLTVWKESLDAKFSGHEECAICYFIMHGPTKSLPKMTCRTCNHKFHSACLLKWFSTSNKSECPLCRNLF